MNKENLLVRINRLDEEALEKCFLDFYESIYRFIYHLSGDVEVAEDITARSFSTLLEKIVNGKGPTENIKSWLFAVARNAYFDERKRELSFPFQAILENQQEPPRVYEEVTRRMEAEWLWHEVNLLAPDQRTAIVLKYLEGFSTNEIASTLGATNGAVRMLVHRGLQHLKNRVMIESALFDAKHIRANHD